MAKKKGKRKRKSKTSSYETLKARIADININRPAYKRRVISQIKRSKLPKEKKERLLKTARAIKPNSWTWRESWDKGNIFRKKKKKKTRTKSWRWL